MSKGNLPEFLRPYFWDVRFEDIKAGESEMFVTKRIIDRGDSKSLHWLRQHYSKDTILQLLKESRDLSAKTATFWADYLGLEYSEVLCLQKPFSPIHFGLYS